MIYRIKKFNSFFKYYAFIFIVSLFLTNTSKSIENWKNSLNFLDGSKIKFTDEFFYNGLNDDILDEMIGNLMITNAKTKDLEKNIEVITKTLNSMGRDVSQENYWLYPVEFKPVFLDTVNFDRFMAKNCSIYSKIINLKKNNNEKLGIQQFKKLMQQCMPIIFKKLFKTTKKPFFRFLRFNKTMDAKAMLEIWPEMESKKKFEHNIYYSKKYFQKGKYYLLQNENKETIYKAKNITTFYNLKFDSISYISTKKEKLSIFSIHCFKKCNENQVKEFNQMISPIVKINEYINLYKIKKEKDLENIAVAARGAYNLYRISRVLLLF